MIELFLGIPILGYFVWTAFTIYLTCMSKITNSTTMVGKIILYHGLAWMYAMCGIAVLTLSIIFANMIMNALHIQVYFGG